MSATAALLVAVAAALCFRGSRRARDRVLPRAPAATDRQRSRARVPESDPLALALALDLMGACLEAGVPLPASLSAAATVADPASVEPLAAMAAALRRGGDADAWASCADEPRLAPLVRICRRVGTTGAAAGDDLRRAAAELRRSHQAERRRRSQRAAVWVVLPLGLCFLPAFLLLTVVPVVAALLPGVR